MKIPPSTTPSSPPVSASIESDLTVLAAWTSPNDRESQLFRIRKDRVVIGSIASADIRLPESSAGMIVSPIHAILEVDARDGQATLFDLASESGTRINGVAIITQVLRGGDQIEIGGHRIDIDFTRQKSVPAAGRHLLQESPDQSPYLIEEPSRVQEIFNHTATTDPALEVVMSWCRTILNVSHFVNQAAVKIGSHPRNDFGLPPILSEPEYTLASRSGQEFVLHLHPLMKGVVYRQGRLLTVEKLLEDSRSLSIGKRDFAKIILGEVHFYVSYSEAPPTLKRRSGDRDPFFVKLMGSSLIGTALILFGLAQMDPPKMIEAEQLPERIATILYQPVVKKAPQYYAPRKQDPAPVEAKNAEPKPKATVKVDIKPKLANEPKPVPKEMNVGGQKEVVAGKGNAVGKTNVTAIQREAKEGEGARAKGVEGQRGSKTSKIAGEPQNKAVRPAANAQKNGSGAPGNSEVPNNGNADIFKGLTSRIDNILGNSAGNSGAGGQKLSGFGGFTTEGKGGLALSGEGSGGGGNADTMLGGLGNKGVGGGKVGTGLGASGTGQGLIGGRARVSIKSGGPEEAIVMGSIDADAIEAAMNAHRDEFRLCYERELNAANPNLAGRIGTTFVIGSSGRVTQAGIASTTLKSPPVEQCVVRVIRRIDFPIPNGAGIVQVNYPFKFAPAGSGR